MITLEDLLEIINDSTMIQLMGSDSQQQLTPDPIPADELANECEEHGFEAYLDATVMDIVIGKYIFINEWEEDGVGKYSLWTFWADKIHMKRCLGLDKKWDSYGDNMYENGMSKIVSIQINKAKSRNYKEIVAAMAQAFENIEIKVYTEKEEK